MSHSDGSTVDATAQVAQLRAVFDGLGRVAVAVSGGIDSLTLLAFAARHHRDVLACHAASAAVPPEATSRTRALAASLGVELLVLDVGELGDTRYTANPLDRCYTCKSHLYDGINAAPATTGATIVAGTNRDDLGDFRPGLRAADERAVRHPFAEAGLGKADVRALARSLALGELAELPAQPCLASRVETGIAIDAPLLHAIHDVEARVRRLVGDTAVVRCRVRAGRAELELDEQSLARVQHPALREALVGAVLDVASVTSYRRGSAFLRVV